MATEAGNFVAMGVLAELSSVNADIIATQSILVGLMNSLLQNGVQSQTIEEAFEFAADVAIQGSEETSSRLPSKSLEIIDHLKSAVLGDPTPPGQHI